MKKIAITAFLLPLFFSTSFSLTLKESIGIAAKQNPTILTAQKKVNAASAKLSQAYGAFMPTIKLDGNYGNAYTQPQVMEVVVPNLGGGISQRFTTGTEEVALAKNIALSLTQPIFVSSLFPGLAIAQKGRLIAEEELRKNMIDVSYNVTSAYYMVLSYKKYIEVCEESLKLAKSHESQVNAMLNSGVSTKADLLRSQVQVANSEIALTKAINSLELAKCTFNNTLGRPVSTEVILSDNVAINLDEISLKIPELPKFEDLLDIAFQYRPDWKQFELSMQIAEDNVNLSRTGYIPSVVLAAQSGDRISSYNYSPLYNIDVKSWSIAGIASWTIFDGLQIANKVREANENLEAQKANEKQVRDSITLEIKDAYLSVKNAVDTIAPAKKAVQFAQEGYKVSNLRYNSGVGTNIEVIDAQAALTQAKTNYIRNLFDIETARAKLKKVIGEYIS